LPAELRLALPGVRRREHRHLARAPLSGALRPAQPASAHQDGPAERLARSSGHPQPGASSASVCQHAALVPSSGCRWGRPVTARAEFAARASWPAPAWHPMAAAAGVAREMVPPSETKAVEVAESALPVALALRALSPPAEAAVVPCGEAAQPSAASVGSGAQVQPPAVEAAEWDAAAEPQQAAVAAEPDAEQLPEVAMAAAQRDAEVLRPAEAAELDAEVLRPEAAVRGAAELLPGAVEARPWARQPAAERPALAAWVCRPDQPLPWPGPRRAVRSAHAMRRSRAALPSRQLWQAARCEGLS